MDGTGMIFDHWLRGKLPRNVLDIHHPKTSTTSRCQFMCLWNRKDVYRTPPHLIQNDWEDVEILHESIEDFRMLCQDPTLIET